MALPPAGAPGESRLPAREATGNNNTLKTSAAIAPLFLDIINPLIDVSSLTKPSG
jgi:hypothetical protein